MMQLRIGVLTVSDRVSAGQMEDAGGPAVEEALREVNQEVSERAVVPDEADRIAAVLRHWADELKLDVIFTTGGTGLSPRDVAPEATSAVAERLVPGIAQAILAASLHQTPYAMLSRAVAAQRGATLIINLPGSPRGAAQGVEVVAPILEHAVNTLHGGRH
jgi:molybdenum cofactor synthesis domain-containing protein